MPTKVAVIDPGSEGAVFRLRPLASGVELKKRKNADTAVRAINVVILVRRMMKLLFGLGILVADAKTLKD
jgi:hypothetical protein